MYKQLGCQLLYTVLHRTLFYRRPPTRPLEPQFPIFLLWFRFLGASATSCPARASIGWTGPAVCVVLLKAHVSVRRRQLAVPSTNLRHS